MKNIHSKIREAIVFLVQLNLVVSCNNGGSIEWDHNSLYFIFCCPLFFFFFRLSSPSHFIPAQYSCFFFVAYYDIDTNYKVFKQSEIVRVYIKWVFFSHTLKYKDIFKFVIFLFILFQKRVDEVMGYSLLR